MTDLALALEQPSFVGDICIQNGDLVLDDGLGSLVLMSLLTDARAQREDVDADEQDLRGWWGDALSDRPLGGRLWTLGRAKTTNENRLRARDFAAESLAWLIDDGIAASVDVQASRIEGEGSAATLRLDITITRGDGSRIDLLYDFLWRAMA